MADIIWERNLAAALERAGPERRFVLADFSKGENVHKTQTVTLVRLIIER